MKKLINIVLLVILLFGLMPMRMEADGSMTEPKLQVKLVNYLGNRTSIPLSVSGSYSINGTSTKLSSTKSYIIKAEQSNISLYDDENRKLITANIVSITPDNEQNSVFINGREYYGSFDFIVEGNLYVRPINNIYIEDYLKSVVPAEMYASWDKEALKAQAVAARTYAYYRLGKVINDTTSYQVYGGANMLHPNSTAAVEETVGEIVTYNGSVIDALFSASNGGMSENNHNEFGSPALPYFPIQSDDYDKKIQWDVSIQKQQINLSGLDLKNPDSWWYSTIEKDANFTSKIISWLSQNGYSNKRIKIVSISKLVFYDKTESGRVTRGDLEFQFFVKDKLDSTGKLELQNGYITNVTADKIRSYIGMNLMSSTLITEAKETSTAFSFAGLGNGHGVGMSQHGTNNRVIAGYKYQDVLAFYYPGTKLVKQYEKHQGTTAFSPIKVQLNGKDFSNGYFGNNTTYVNWNALKVLQIPYKYNGDGVFTIEGRSVQAIAINGDWYIQWKSLSPGRIIYRKISGGYNFVYARPIKIQFNGKDFGQGGYFRDNTTYVNWNALKVLQIPYKYNGDGVFTIEGRSVQGIAINGDWYIRWTLLAPGKITYQEISGGYNFTYTKPINIQFNGRDFAQGGYFRDNTTYVNWNALKVLQIPYQYNGDGLFTIEGRSVQGIAINGDWYIRWTLFSPGKLAYQEISGGYNFIYAKPIKIQFNGQDFSKGGYFRDNTTYVNWNILKILQIPYQFNANGLYTIEGRSVEGIAINGDWYIQWKLLSPGNITFQEISGGYNFVYTKPIKVQFNGKDFSQGGYFLNNTTYVNWNALKLLQIPYNHNGDGQFTIEGRSVQGLAINGDWYIQWKLLSPKITYQEISGGYNFIYPN
jgi:SpoIID/LytB domain protein